MTYSYTVDRFLNNKVDVSRLKKEIDEKVDITIACVAVTLQDGVAFIEFKTEISDEEEDNLNAVVAQHSGEPLKQKELLMATIVPENAKYYEKGDLTQEIYSAETWRMNITNSKIVFTFDFSHPFTKSLLAASFLIRDNMVGDWIEVYMAPETVIGAVTAPAQAGSYILSVNDTVVQNLKIGYFVCTKYGESDGVMHGRVKHIGAQHIELFEPLSVDVNAGAFVRMNIKIVPYMYFDHPQLIRLGDAITTGQRIPANVVMRIVYHNDTGLSKTVSVNTEYLY